MTLGWWIFLALTFFGIACSFGSVSTEAWVRRFNGISDSDDQALALAVESGTNLVVVGYSNTGIKGKDWLVIKYSGNGAPMWTNVYNGFGDGDDVAEAVAVDNSGRIVVTGYSSGLGTGFDFTTIAYSSGGEGLWTNSYHFAGDDQAQALVVDVLGRVFVTGKSVGSSPYSYATIAYSSAGVPLWTNRYTGPAYGEHCPSAIATDDAGRVFVTGYSYGGASNLKDVATVGYDSASGALLWVNRFNGNGHSDDSGNALVVNSLGNVVVAGFSSTVLLTIAYSNTGIPLWTNRYSFLTNGTGIAQAISADANGNVFVTGDSSNINGNGNDTVTIAYSNSGLPLWTNRYRKFGSLWGYTKAIVTSGVGNVFVSAYDSDGSNSHNDFATIGYSGMGVPLWTNHYSAAGGFDNFAAASAVDAAGNVAVTGSSHLGSGPYDWATISYSSNGLPRWTNLFNGFGNGNDGPKAVAVTTNGHIIVTGYTLGSNDGGECTTIAFDQAGQLLWANRCGISVASMAADSEGHIFVTGVLGSDFATIAYSAAGVPFWTNYYDGPGHSADAPAAVTVDVDGNVIVTGSSSVLSGAGEDYATIKYSGAGTPLWTNRLNGKLFFGRDYPSAVVTDGVGDVIVTGRVQASINYDIATVKYSSGGIPIWTNFYGSPGNWYDEAMDVAVDSIGNVFVTGYAGGANRDFVTIAYSPAGAPRWTNLYNGPANGSDQAKAIAVDGSGNVYVAGESGNTNGTPDFATIAYANNGVAMWTNRYKESATGSASALGVVVDAEDHVFVTGVLYSSNNFDQVTVSYSVDGTPLATDRYNGAANGEDRPLTRQSLAVASGGVVVVGASDGYYGSASAADFAIVKYKLTIGPNITLQPMGQTKPIASLVQFSAAANGTAPLAYQWTKNSLPVTDSGNIVGSQSNRLIILSAQPSDIGGYALVATNGYGSATSGTASLAISPMVYIANSPTSLGFTNGGFSFKIIGPTGQDVVVQASSNLVDWLPIQTNQVGDQPFQFADSEGDLWPTRFYRAVLAP